MKIKPFQFYDYSKKPPVLMTSPYDTAWYSDDGKFLDISVNLEEYSTYTKLPLPEKVARWGEIHGFIEPYNPWEVPIGD